MTKAYGEWWTFLAGQHRTRECGHIAAGRSYHVLCDGVVAAAHLTTNELQQRAHRSAAAEMRHGVPSGDPSRGLFFMLEPHWTAYVQALSAPLVALIAGGIASVISYRQWQTAKAKVTLDLFEKRLEVYDEV